MLSAATESLQSARVAVVHPWLNRVRGGERVFFELARAFPDADLYLLFGHRDLMPPDIRPRLVGTSFIQRLPVWRMAYRATLPLLPAAVEGLPLAGYDLVVSSASGWTHGVLTGDLARHIAYIHSPPRYLWGTPAPTVSGRIASVAMAPTLRKLRSWDVVVAGRPDYLVANSRATQAKIERRYRRDATVVHPPVDPPNAVESSTSGDYLVAVAELVPYKRIDIAVAAAKEAGRRLVVVGDGPERARLEELARGGDVTFAGRVSDAEVGRILRGAAAYVLPGIEDFGIATVEALACGTPAIVLAQGGSAEIVTEETGVLVAEQSIPAFADAIRAFCPEAFDSDALRIRAAHFSPEAFRLRMREIAESELARGVSAEVIDDAL